MATDYLITGGAGFIGSNIAAHLVGQGKTVRILDNFLTGKRENLRAIAKRAEIIEGDLRDLARVRRAVKNVRYVLHAAALPSVPRSVAEPTLTHEINVTGTLNLLVAARDAGCRRVVFSSSSSVYGDTPALPKRENMAPCPISPYGLHKLTGEYYCRLFWELYGLETISLRYFNVFGPRQDPNSEYAAVIPRFITRMLAGKRPVIYGDGRQSRDFSFIANVVAANLAACRAPRAALGEAFNIAGGGRITLLELVRVINRSLGTTLKPVLESPRPGDIRHSHADIAKARRLLRWQPQTNFAQGIERAIDWYRR